MSIFLPCKIHLWCISPSDTEQIRAGYSLFNSILCASVWDYRYRIATSNRSLWNKKKWASFHFLSVPRTNLSAELYLLSQRREMSKILISKTQHSLVLFGIASPCTLADWQRHCSRPNVFFSSLCGALLKSDCRGIHNCLAALIKYWDGPHVVCQVSLAAGVWIHSIIWYQPQAPLFILKENPSVDSVVCVKLRPGWGQTFLTLFTGPI